MGAVEIKEIMAKNFPDLRKDLDIQVQEAHRSPRQMKLKKS